MEGFLLTLKQFCEASNHMTVPYTVARNWALARALTRAKGESSSCLTLDLLPSSDHMLGDVLRAATSASPLLHALTTTRDHKCVSEARYLKRVVRDGVEARCGQWLLLASRSGKQFVACVQEMAEVVLPGGPKVRLWCTDRISLEGITEDADGMFRLKKPSPTAAACTLLVRLETVCVTNLKCCERNGLLEFRYCYGGN